LDYKKDLRLRHTALTALGEYSDKEAINRIDKMIADEIPETRQVAILMAVDKLKEYPQFFNSLYQSLHDPYSVVYSTTAIALTPHIGDYPQLKEPIEGILKKSNNPDFQKRILLNLGQSKSKHAVDMIKPYLDSPDMPTKQVAVYSLGLTDDKAALVELNRMMKQDNEIIRALAIQSYVKVPDAPFEDVVPYLEDENEKVRLATVESLSGKVADIPSISESFIKIAEIDSDPFSSFSSYSWAWLGEYQ